MLGTPCLLQLPESCSRYMNQTHEYQRDEQRVQLIIYHLIWCPRRRKPVLVGPVAERCRALISEKGAEQGWEMLALAIQPDHIHLFVRVWPSDSAADVVKACKGLTAFHLRQEFPHLLKLPSLWTRSYFASTAGNVSQQTLQRYIAAQTGR
jgi:REP-associated tyrosine transposase